MPKYKLILHIEVEVESEFTYLKTVEKIEERAANDFVSRNMIAKLNIFNIQRLKAVKSRCVKIHRTI